MIQCYFDGACEPANPYGNMGVGAIILKNKVPVFTYSHYIPASKQNSNNVAEYLGLEQVLIWLRDNNTDGERVFISGDSKLVINQMNNYWRIKQGLYKEHAIRCKEIRSQIGRKLEFSWIPRERNQMADDLSKNKMVENNVEFKIQPV